MYEIESKSGRGERRKVARNQTQNCSSTSISLIYYEYEIFRRTAYTYMQHVIIANLFNANPSWRSIERRNESLAKIYCR